MKKLENNPNKDNYNKVWGVIYSKRWKACIIRTTNHWEKNLKKIQISKKDILCSLIEKTIIIEMSTIQRNS
jgi:hypothetical protein